MLLLLLLRLLLLLLRLLRLLRLLLLLLLVLCKWYGVRLAVHVRVGWLLISVVVLLLRNMRIIWGTWLCIWLCMCLQHISILP